MVWWERDDSSAGASPGFSSKRIGKAKEVTPLCHAGHTINGIGCRCEENYYLIYYGTIVHFMRGAKDLPNFAKLETTRVFLCGFLDLEKGCTCTKSPEYN